MNLSELAAPFPPEDIKHRQGPGGRQMAYVTNRAIQDRLDKVVGPGNWKNEFIPWEIGTPGVLCGLSIKVEDEWVTKWDGAEQTDIEAMKGGLSDAMKRAAVQWGIGRYLYQDGSAGSATGEAGVRAVRTPAQPTPDGGVVSNGQVKAVVNPDTAHPPTDKQVSYYQSLVSSPVFTEEERKRALEWLATKATRQTTKDQLAWLKNQVDTRKAGAA